MLCLVAINNNAQNTTMATYAAKVILTIAGGDLSAQLKVVGQPKPVEVVMKVTDPKVSKTLKRLASELGGSSKKKAKVMAETFSF